MPLVFLAPLVSHLPVAIPSADVNWLLSTEVQSGAALVAIVGGLLVARLAGLSGERTYLRRAITDVMGELAQARDEKEAAEAMLDELVANAFIRYAKPQLLELSGAVDEQKLADLIIESGWEVSEHGLTDIVKPYIAEMHSAFEQASGYIVGRDSGEATLEGARAAVKAAMPAVDSRLAEDVISAMNSRGDFGSSPFGGYLIGAAADIGITAADRQTRDRRMDEAQSRIDQQQGSIRAREARLASLQTAEAQAARPEGMGRVLAALVYLAIACVVVPLAMMSWGRTSLPAMARALIVVLFVSGLVVFLLVMLNLLRDRSRPGTRERRAHES